MTQDLFIDEAAVGELTLTGLCSLNQGVAVALVTGDEATSREAEQLPGTTETVAVKRGLGRYSADCLHPSTACDLIHEAARTAAQEAPVCRTDHMPGATRWDVTFTATAMADVAAMVPGVQRTGGRCVCFTHEDFLRQYEVFTVITVLANAVMDEVY